MKAKSFELVRYDADDGKVFDWAEPHYQEVLIDEKSAELLQAYNDADIVLTVGSISTTKQTSIIYNSSDGKYYLWR